MDDNISTEGTGTVVGGTVQREEVVIIAPPPAAAPDGEVLASMPPIPLPSNFTIEQQQQIAQITAQAVAQIRAQNPGAQTIVVPVSLTFQSFHGPVQNNYIDKSTNIDKSERTTNNNSGPVHNVNLSDNAALETLTVNVGGGGGDEQQMTPSKAKKSTRGKHPKTTGGTAAAATKSNAKATPKKAAQKKAAATGVAQSSFVGLGISVGSRVQLTECGRNGVVVKLGKGKMRINYLIELEDSHETVWRVASKFITSKSIPPAGQEK